MMINEYFDFGLLQNQAWNFLNIKHLETKGPDIRIFMNLNPQDFYDFLMFTEYKVI